jgi:hypothetical protein
MTMHNNTFANIISDSALDNITSLASSAVLIEMSVSGWDAKITDKEVTLQVALDNNVKIEAKKAGTYRKNTLPDCKLLIEINSFIGAIRNHHLQVTSPWSNNGVRLLANSFLIDYQSWFNNSRDELFDMVERFLAQYPTLVEDLEAGARFSLGDLYKPRDYPSVEEVRRKFKMSLDFSPVPVAGDFRIDINNAGRDQVIEIANRSAANRLAGAMQESWEKLHKVLSNLSTKLADKDDGGGRQVFRDSLLGNANDLVAMLQHLNFSRDPALDAAAAELKRVLSATDVKEIRSDDDERRNVKAKVDDILTRFAF